MPIQNTAREVEPVLLRPFPSTADEPLGHKRVTPHVLRRVVLHAGFLHCAPRLSRVALRSLCQRVAARTVLWAAMQGVLPDA